jgi:RNA polymerase sigma-70 factor (ECF subfamily)
MTVKEYNQCVENYADLLYRFLIKSVRNMHEAGDLVQESFTRLWERREQVSYQKAKAYLFTTGYHVMIDRYRKQKPESALEEVRTVQTVTEEVPDLQEVLHQALSKLPAVQRSVILLRDYEGYSYQEIGGITGLSESQVKVYIFRARKALKAYLVRMDNVI